MKWYVPEVENDSEGELTAPGKRNTRDTYVKNYTFDFDFGAPWGQSSVTMTSVRGHLTELHFTPEYKKWEHPPPDSLFNAPVVTLVAEVGWVLYGLDNRAWLISVDMILLC